MVCHIVIGLMALGMSMLSIPASVREFDIDVGAGVSIHVVDQGPIDLGGPDRRVQWGPPSHRYRPAFAGRDDHDRGGDTPEQRAKDLDRLFARLKTKRIVLVGGSQGVQDVAAHVAAFWHCGRGGIGSDRFCDFWRSRECRESASHRSPVVARIDRPTLVVASPRSFELEDQRGTASRIPGADFRIVANAGHAVFFDQPAAFNALIRAFLLRQGV